MGAACLLLLLNGGAGGEPALGDAAWHRGHWPLLQLPLGHT